MVSTTIIGALLAVLVLPKGTPTTTQDATAVQGKGASASWQLAYADQARQSLLHYDDYTANTEYYDYTNPAIAAVAEQIAAESTSAKDAMQRALTYVYDHLTYIKNEPDEACYSGTAPSILASGQGQCDTQAIALIALLRHMRIAAVPVGGCVKSTGCVLQSLFPIDAPKLRVMAVVDPAATTFSRAAGGGLHAWVTAWDPAEGWLALEETTGRFANTKCYAYQVELFVPNDQKTQLCISTNFLYAAACSAGNLDAMNKLGLGMTGEVAPP